MYEKIKKFYAMHLYSREQVWMFVEKEVITQEQFAEIVGDSE